MIKAILIDDEEDAIFMLRNLMERHFKNIIQVVAEANEVSKAVDVIIANNPDVVFLDIRMREGTGFDVLERIENKKFEVVFVTAFDQYAIKAFNFSALGYLMKPIRITELKMVVENLHKRIESLKGSSENRLKVLVENYSDERKIKKLVISNMEGFKVIALEDIIRLEGDRNYTHFVLSENKKITTSKTIGEYEELLTSHGFFRVHQSTIVNLRLVVGYRKNEEQIAMADGKLIKLSRHRKADFIKRFI